MSIINNDFTIEVDYVKKAIVISTAEYHGKTKCTVKMESFTNDVKTKNGNVVKACDQQTLTHYFSLGKPMVNLIQKAAWSEYHKYLAHEQNQVKIEEVPMQITPDDVDFTINGNSILMSCSALESIIELTPEDFTNKVPVGNKGTMIFSSQAKIRDAFNHLKLPFDIIKRIQKKALDFHKNLPITSEDTISVIDESEVNDKLRSEVDRLLSEDLKWECTNDMSQLDYPFDHLDNMALTGDYLEDEYLDDDEYVEDNMEAEYQEGFIPKGNLEFHFEELTDGKISEKLLVGNYSLFCNTVLSTITLNDVDIRQYSVEELTRLRGYENDLWNEGISISKQLIDKANRADEVIREAKTVSNTLWSKNF